MHCLQTHICSIHVGGLLQPQNKCQEGSLKAAPQATRHPIPRRDEQSGGWNSAQVG